MNIRHLLSATALAALACCQAHAQTSVTLYGNIDVGLDHINKSQGNTAGTIYAANPGLSNPVSYTRVSPSLMSQSLFGIKTVEDLGGGYKARVTLEGALSADNGTLGQDGRIFGKQAYVALGTPIGEIRAGRQGTPMLTSFYMASTEELGSTDMMGAGIIVDNTQIYQDNMLCYVFRSGSWLGELSYSPNAGVPNLISAARSTTPATSTTGQIVGGYGAGGEQASGQGRSEEAMLTYLTPELKLTGVYHHTKFGVKVGQYSSTTGATTPTFNVESFSSFMLGGKYVIPGWGTTIAANFHTGQYEETGTIDPKINSYALGFRQPIGDAYVVGAEWSLSKFTNFDHGKDTGLILVGDYLMSKRTTLYTRIGYVKDDRGTPASVTLLPASYQVAGGPSALLVPLGAAELPVFSGAGINIDGRTSIVSVGIRHQF